MRVMIIKLDPNLLTSRSLSHNAARIMAGKRLAILVALILFALPVYAEHPSSDGSPLDLSPVHLEISVNPVTIQPRTPTNPINPMNIQPGKPTSPIIPLIVTSRPTVTDTSITVPKGSLQMENGVTYLDNSNRTRSWSLPETLFRLGIRKNTELRFVSPNYTNISEAKAAPTASGSNNLGDIQLGLSHHIQTPGDVHIALIPLLNIPTGTESVSSKGLDPEFRVAGAKNLTRKLSVGTQLNTRWNSYPKAPSSVIFTPSIVAYYYFRPTFGSFAEYAATVPTTGDTIQIVQFGLLYVFRRRHQLDARIATGLNKNSPDILVGVGYSFRIDGLFD